MRLKGKVALVTGAGQGIGRAITLTFAKEGADVIVNDIDLQLSREVAGVVQSSGGRVQAIKADISIIVEINRMVQKVIEGFGRIDILVNNASAEVHVPAVDQTEAQWDIIMDTNLKGMFFCCQTIGKQMIHQRYGKIVNIASIVAYESYPNLAAYSASKGGVLQLTRSLAIEWAEYNINVNSVSPGTTRTARLEANIARDPDFLKARLQRIPLRRVNEPQDIANAVLFLASSESGNITGQDIIVDGGIRAIHAGHG